MNSIIPMGDQAALVYFEDERKALQYAATVRQWKPDWLVDVVQAYTSVGIYFDLERISYREVERPLASLSNSNGHQEPAAKLHNIPCCYELQLDLERVSAHAGLPPETVIKLHSRTEYTVFAIGFCPGFPYLGYLPEEIRNVPRLETPRVRLEEGSVGLTGRQTGIYTQIRPGGWNIIGRTPLQLVDVADEYFPLRTGDRIRFGRIDETEFRQLSGERL